MLASALNPELPQFVRPNEVSRALGVTPASVRRWIREGVIPGVILGGTYRVPQNALKSLLRDAAERSRERENEETQNHPENLQ